MQPVFAAGLGAASLHPFLTFRTLDKKQVAGVMRAIGMRIRRLPALVAMADDLVGNSLSQPFIENEVLAVEPGGKVPGADLACVGDDAPV
jgi:hypothetical protein